MLNSKGQETVIAEAGSIASAVRSAERFVAKEKPRSVGLVLRGTRWRAEPATEKQINFIKGMHVELPPGLTKGQASHLIALLSAKKSGIWQDTL